MSATPRWLSSTRESTTVKTILTLAFLLAVTLPAIAAELYVSPTGSDQASGTADRPFATLERARDEIRALRKNGPLLEPVLVNVKDGAYSLSTPLVLLPEDSGTAEAVVTYRAAPNARPVFSGGRLITGWKPGPGGIWTTRIPEVAAAQLYFEQLFVNGKRATRARMPNKFYYFIQDLSQQIQDKGRGRVASEATQTIQLREEDFKESLARLRDGELKDVNLVVYHKWDNTRRFLDSIDPASNSLSTSGQGMKSWNSWQRNSHFQLENFLAALDAAGEWFLHRDGTLYLKPGPGETPDRSTIVAPVCDKFLVLQGDPAAGQFVEHVRFEGLRFQYAQWLTPPEGFEPAQAASPIDAVVMADGARHVQIENCEIGHIGTYGVWFRKGCTDCTIRQNYIHDFGAGGVRIGEMILADNEAERTGRITVDNNIIRHGGRIFPCAVGVWVGQSGDNVITHNEIADLFYTGISVGWRWGYAESLAKRNTIAFNHVHHIGWGVLSDMGGIYTLGPSEGTVVRNNVFHDIYSYSYGGWGLYTDEGSTGILFENNLVYRTKSGGFHQHYGKENIVRNNILAFAKDQQLQATRVEDHLSFTFENNIVYYDEGNLLSGAWDRVRHVSRDNCYWRTDQAPILFLDKTLAQWQVEGHETASIIADPGFDDPADGNFRFVGQSPAFALGFKPFDPDEAGVQGDAEWIRLADEESYPALEVVPEPPPFSFNETFESDAVGQSPADAEVHVDNKGDAIVVTDETAATGKRSLKLVDAPDLSRSYYPHLVYSGYKYEEGTLRNSISLRVEPLSQIRYEWRDYTAGRYRTGPQFEIRGGKLSLGPAGSLDLPSGAWVKFEVTSTLGGGSPSTWNLRVDIPGQPPQILSDLPWQDNDFKALTWVGLTSNATAATTFYLDDFVLSSVALQEGN